LIPGALFDSLGTPRQQPQVVERAEALERLEPQVVRKSLDGSKRHALRRQRL
jgi:hypothetical protein